ncbi:MAG: PilZ domain-containing protein [Myxococcota bacterium]|nr:PilZ domain-containing protein [Myxococcota bacterium]
MDDRREHARHAVWFPIAVRSADGEGLAISYDLSTGGLLMACPGRVEPGAVVTVTFRMRAEAPERTAQGRVVRIEQNQPEGAWRWRIAVEFDAPMSDLESLIASSTAAAGG